MNEVQPVTYHVKKAAQKGTSCHFHVKQPTKQRIQRVCLVHTILVEIKMM